MSKVMTATSLEEATANARELLVNIYTELVLSAIPERHEQIMTEAEIILHDFNRRDIVDGVKLGVGLQLAAAICGMWMEKSEDKELVDESI